jgi:hypothetical protein
MKELLKFKFCDPEVQHAIKWKDEIGKDVCEYAHSDEMKLLLA